jgi:hypothetical protein
MLDLFKHALTTQFEAALCMLNDCLRLCPDAGWDALVAKYPFWHIAYHTLIFVDLYLTPSHGAFQFRPELHPGGWGEWDDEHPSRRFERDELLRYVAICRQKAKEIIVGETAETLAGPSGFDWLKITRAEMHLYNLRHIQHHVGGLNACLRRVEPSIDPKWMRAGWRELG